MAKVICSQGRIVHVIDEGVVFTSLKEVEGEDPMLASKRSAGQPVIQLPKSYLGVLAQERLTPEIAVEKESELASLAELA